MFNLLDTVALDLPEHGLRPGDLGAVVDVHEPNGLEVEFVFASGKRVVLEPVDTWPGSGNVPGEARCGD